MCMLRLTLQLAAGRVVGSLAVVTARDEDASAAMLASWISQVLNTSAIAHQL